MLHQLKPRWSLEPIKNFSDRFGYSGGLTNLDFSRSNINNEDLKSLAVMSHMNHLRSVNFSFCEKIEESSIIFFIGKRGTTLYELSLQNIPITEQLFYNCFDRLPKLKTLDISGEYQEMQILKKILYQAILHLLQFILKVPLQTAQIWIS